VPMRVFVRVFVRECVLVLVLVLVQVLVLVLALVPGGGEACPRGRTGCAGVMRMTDQDRGSGSGMLEKVRPDGPGSGISCLIVREGPS
jgi:hypothetical protein